MIEDQNILVTGGVGSIGSEIVRELLKYNPNYIRVVDNNETGLFKLDKELNNHKIHYVFGDIRDKDRMIELSKNIDVIYHTAALKHVPSCECNPLDAVKTNIIGTQNMIDAAIANNVIWFLNISTDKAVNPVSTMGATKLVAEKLIKRANISSEYTRFASVRFGNVLLSRGSVVPLFDELIRQNKPIPITDERMTRFMMSLHHAVELIIRTTNLMYCNGDTYILKMPVIRIIDLAKVMLKHQGKPESNIELVGIRAGEKIHEELLTSSEMVNAYETDDIIIINPDEITYNFKKLSINSYSSKDYTPLTHNEIKLLLGEIYET